MKLNGRWARISFFDNFLHYGQKKTLEMGHGDPWFAHLEHHMQSKGHFRFILFVCHIDIFQTIMPPYHALD
jgi:hypothetical protein